MSTLKQKIYVNARFLTQPMSGVQHYALNLSLRLKEINPEIVFLTCSQVIHKEEAKKLEVIAFGKFKSQLWEQFELPAMLKRMGNPLLINLANTAPMNYDNQLNTIHDLAFEKNEPWFSNRYTMYYRWLMPKVADHCLKLFTVSRFSASELIGYYGIKEDKIRVIPNSITEEMQLNLRREISLITEKPFLLVVGSIDPRKNIGRIIEAFGRLKIAGLKLIIAGRKSGVFKDNGITDQILKNPDIIWKNNLNNFDLVSHYKQAVGLINLSQYEGFGLNNLEAMACGCPLVVSDIPVFREVCKDAALYVDSKDIHAINNAILNLFADPQSTDERVAKGLGIAKNFSGDFSAQEILRTVAELGF